MTAAIEGVSGQQHDPAVLYPRKDPVPIDRRLGGPQGRSGGAENLYPPGFDPRIVQPVAQSLYQLGYPTHLLQHGIGQNLRTQVVYNRDKLSY